MGESYDSRIIWFVIRYDSANHESESKKQKNRNRITNPNHFYVSLLIESRIRIKLTGKPNHESRIRIINGVTRITNHEPESKV